MQKVYLIAEKDYLGYAVSNLANGVYSIQKQIDAQCFLETECADSIDDVDFIFLAISTNKLLERVLAKLKKEYPMHKSPFVILKLYALDKYINFVDDSGYISEYYVDYVNVGTKYMVHLETHVLDFCNLNCKACNNFSPFCNENVICDSKKFEEDLKLVRNAFEIGRLFLLGGEPLLSPDNTIKYISSARKQCANSEIRLLTNGLLLPQMTDDFMNKLRENDIVVFITEYPPTSRIKSQIVKALSSNKVKYVFGRKVDYFVKRLTLSPEENPYGSNEFCGSSGCHMFADGKITKCPDMLTIKYFDKSIYEDISEKDFHALDNIEADLLLDELAAPGELCKYCAVERAKVIEWSSAGKSPEKKDWLVESHSEWLNRTKGIFESWKEKNGCVGKEFVCFGAGRKLRQYSSLLQEILNVKRVVDNYATESRVNGITLVSLDEITSDTVIVITPNNSKAIVQITRQLQNEGKWKFFYLDEILEIFRNQVDCGNNAKLKQSVEGKDNVIRK